MQSITASRTTSSQEEQQARMHSSCFMLQIIDAALAVIEEEAADHDPHSTVLEPAGVASVVSSLSSHAILSLIHI